MTEPAPDHSWLTFERTDWRGRTRTLDYKGRPITPRAPVELPELTDDWYAWIRDHMALAGIELSERQPPRFRYRDPHDWFRNDVCAHRGPDVIESGGIPLCPTCRQPVHD